MTLSKTENTSARSIPRRTKSGQRSHFPVICRKRSLFLPLELAQEMEVEVAGIYIGDDPIPNAFTTFALEGGNTVFINSNLLMILDEQSVRAVIAHELGHIKNNDVMHQIGVLVPQQFIRLWMLLLIVQTFGVVLLSTGVWQVVYRSLFLWASLWLL